MAVYENFAQVYDELMDEVPYAQWADHIVRILHKEGIKDGLVLDLGCGTGRMTRLLAGRGYDMIGVDLSEEMLGIAKDQSPEDILYLMQDMREFELYGTVRAVVCVCDSLNYIMDEQELLKVFRLVNNYLDPGGLFLFDMNTEHKYRDLIGDTVIAEDRNDVSFIWYNEYDEKTRMNVIDLSLFVRERGNAYKKYQEIHEQRAYDPDRIRKLLCESGLIVEGAFDGYTFDPADGTSERILYIAREQEKYSKEW